MRNSNTWITEVASLVPAAYSHPYSRGNNIQKHL